MVSRDQQMHGEIGSKCASHCLTPTLLPSLTLFACDRHVMARSHPSSSEISLPPDCQDCRCPLVPVDTFAIFCVFAQCAIVNPTLWHVSAMSCYFLSTCAGLSALDSCVASGHVFSSRLLHALNPCASCKTASCLMPRNGFCVPSEAPVLEVPSARDSMQLVQQGTAGTTSTPIHDDNHASSTNLVARLGLGPTDRLSCEKLL